MQRVQRVQRERRGIGEERRRTIIAKKEMEEKVEKEECEVCEEREGRQGPEKEDEQEKADRGI